MGQTWSGSILLREYTSSSQAREEENVLYARRGEGKQAN